jgi:adenine-specific DNA-methyltransferase
LTWTNKHLRLLAHDDGSYEWIDPADHRIAEVRLLHDAGTIGETTPSSTRAEDNLLIRGDALNALASLAELPEFAKEYLGKVRLAYLDPPFNTQQSWLHYDVPRPRFRPDTRLDRGGLHVESHGGSDGGRWGGSLRRTE